MSSDKIFNKNNLDHYFYELSKAYKKLGGKKMPSEIILVGGAAIIENYGFREMTSDIDAVIQAASIMDEAINKVGDMFLICLLVGSTRILQRQLHIAENWQDTRNFIKHSIRC